MKKVTQHGSSMIDPPMNELLDKTDCKYNLVIIVAKRAKQLVDGAHSFIETEADKSITVAAKEIVDGKITYIRTKSGIK